jgi:hypothetical protein
MNEPDLHNALAAEFFERIRHNYRDDPYGLLLLASTLVGGIAYDLSSDRGAANFLVDLIAQEAGFCLDRLPAKMVN